MAHKAAINEMKRDVSKYHLNQAVNDNNNTKITEWDLTPEYLEARIGRETWLTTFTVKIPVSINYTEYD